MPAGRPLKFKTAKELEAKAQTYLDETPEEEWTITGLADHLGTFRKVLCEYEHRDKFSNTVKRLKQKIEMSYEKSLRRRGTAGDIFGLKNFGWTDKRDIEHAGKIDSTIKTVVVLPPKDEA